MFSCLEAAVLALYGGGRCRFSCAVGNFVSFSLGVSGYPILLYLVSQVDNPAFVFGYPIYQPLSRARAITYEILIT